MSVTRKSNPPIVQTELKMVRAALRNSERMLFVGAKNGGPMFIGKAAEAFMKVAAIAASPREACGLLVDERDNGRLSFAVSSNAAPGIRDYVIDPYVQRTWLGKTRAVFHSHVSRDCHPSDVDGAMAIAGMWYVIYSILDDEFGIWYCVSSDTVDEKAVWQRSKWPELGVPW